MNNKVNIRFTGIINAHSEIAISRPNATNVWSKDTKAVNMAPHKQVGNSVTFYIPASSIRGTFRAAMTKYLHNLIVNGKVEKVSNQSMVRSSKGGIKGKSDGAAPEPMLAHVTRQVNPIIDAFGGSEPLFIEGALKVLDGVAINAGSTPHARYGARSVAYVRDPDLIDAIRDPESVVADRKANADLKPWKDAATALAKINGKTSPSRAQEITDKAIKKLKASVGDAADGMSVADIINNAERLGKVRQEVTGSSNSALFPLPTTFTIPKSDFEHSMIIRDAYSHTVGMLMYGIRLMSKNSLKFGGLVNKGHGFVDIIYQVEVFDEDSFEWVTDSTVVMRSMGSSKPFEIIPAGEKSVLVDYMDQFQAKLAAGELDFDFVDFDEDIANDNDTSGDDDDQSANA